MLSLILALPLCAGAALPDEPELKLSDPKAVAAALEDLEKAFAKKQKDDSLRTAALTRHGRLVHPDVVEFYADAVKHETPEVSQGALEGLRFMKHPDALEELHAVLRKNKTIKKDDERRAHLIKCIGQHRSASSIEVLADDFLQERDRPALNARLFSIAHVHSVESIETIFELMQKAPPAKLQAWMTDIRMALMVLTGADHGTNAQRWSKWWSDNEKRFELSEKPHKLPKEMQLRWDRFWGYDTRYGRGKKREDRGGDDPEDDR